MRNNPQVIQRKFNSVRYTLFMRHQRKQVSADYFDGEIERFAKACTYNIIMVRTIKMSDLLIGHYHF